MEASASSPIDLIPDPIPIPSDLDDLILLPTGIGLGLREIPDDVWTRCLDRARAAGPTERPRSRGAAAVIVLLWILPVELTARVLWPHAQAG